MAVILGFLLPELTLLVAGTLLLILPRHRQLTRCSDGLAVAALILASCLELGLIGPAWDHAGAIIDSNQTGTTSHHAFSAAIRWSLLVFGLLACGVRRNFDTSSGRNESDQIGWLLFLLAGGLIATTADDLVLLLVAIEVTSLSSMMLLVVSAADRFRTELLLKLTLKNVVATALTTLGAAILVGISGETDLQQIHNWMLQGESLSAKPMTSVIARIVPLASGLVFFGLAARLAVPPFRAWVVDVEQAGSRWSLVTTLLIVRATALVACVRMMVTTLETQAATMEVIAIVLSMTALIVSIAMAYREENLDRLLGCGAVATGGWLLAAMAVWLRAAANSQSPIADMGDFLTGSETLWLAFAAGGIAWIGGQCGLAALRLSGARLINREDLRGIGRRFPVISAAIVICLMSSVGVPPWLGFWEKLAITCGTLIGVVSPSSQAPPVSHGGLVLLTVVLVGHCLLQLRIYLTVVTTMFLERTLTQHARPGRSIAGFVAVTAAFALTVTGLDPTTVISLADPPTPVATRTQAEIEVTYGLIRRVTAVSRRQSQIGYVPSPPGT